MEEKVRVFEIEKEIIKTEKDTKRFILKVDEEGKWYLHTPDASSFSEEELVIILKKLYILNREGG